MGEELTSVVPIYDGFVLRKGSSWLRFARVAVHAHDGPLDGTCFARAAIQKQAVAGNLISEVLLHQLQTQNVPVTPRYLVKTKEAVAPDQPSNASLR